MSRELDEKVARVLGLSAVFPRYSTDLSLLPEMLAWLEKRCAWSAGQIIGEGDYYAEATTDVVDANGFATTIANQRGDSLPEAVANLVVAVAAREKKS